MLQGKREIYTIAAKRNNWYKARRNEIYKTSFHLQNKETLIIYQKMGRPKAAEGKRNFSQAQRQMKSVYIKFRFILLRLIHSQLPNSIFQFKLEQFSSPLYDYSIRNSIWVKIKNSNWMCFHVFTFVLLCFLPFFLFYCYQ